MAVADLVSPGMRLADVGTDHAFLPIYLVASGKIPSAIAMDVREGPLSRAKEHIAGWKMTDQIEARLSDGLTALKPGEADCLVLAGMGGMLVIRILSEQPLVRESLKEIIVQPQSDLPAVRHFFHELDWTELAEDMVQEEGKYYPMMKMGRRQTRTAAPVQAPAFAEGLEDSLPDQKTVLAERFGGLLLAAGHPVLLEYLKREREITARIRKQLEGTQTPSACARLKQVEEDWQLIEAALKEYYD
ncbi:MAG: SAM-dependent methyltransferase [Blautia sp.]|nr:SAM-dependent methyltransferase [Blautia sp.]